MKEARGFASIVVPMFGHPAGRLGRFGGRLMLCRSEPVCGWLAEVLAPGDNDVFGLGEMARVI